jgi:hypothetical protein
MVWSSCTGIVLETVVIGKKEVGSRQTGPVEPTIQRSYRQVGSNKKDPLKSHTSMRMPSKVYYCLEDCQDVAAGTRTQSCQSVV